MKLFSLMGVGKIADPEFGEFDANEDGSFDFPDEFAERIHRVHFDGLPAWEDNTERHARLTEEEIARRSDPASLYDAVTALQQNNGLTAAQLREAEDMRKQIEAEREAEAEAKAKALAEAAAAAAEADRLAAAEAEEARIKAEEDAAAAEREAEAAEQERLAADAEAREAAAEDADAARAEAEESATDDPAGDPAPAADDAAEVPPIAIGDTVVLSDEARAEHADLPYALSQGVVLDIADDEPGQPIALVQFGDGATAGFSVSKLLAVGAVVDAAGVEHVGELPVEEVPASRPTPSA